MDVSKAKFNYAASLELLLCKETMLQYSLNVGLHTFYSPQVSESVQLIASVGIHDCHEILWDNSDCQSYVR